jgi:uncharacterized protein YfaS (alpha-2-macroglobulin family)
MYDRGYSAGMDDGSALQNGEGVLDEKGEYTIKYTPKSGGAEARRYIVKASVYDESGRSIDSVATFSASTKEFFINAIATKDFFKNSDKPNFTVKLEDMNGALFKADVEYELFEVLPPDAEMKKKLKKENVAQPYHYRSYSGEGLNFQKVFEKLELKSLKRGLWNVTKEKSDFGIASLPEGVFKIKMFTKDSAGKKVDGEMFFMVAESGKKLSTYYIPEVTLLSKSEYKIGETVSILFGSSEYSGHMVGFLLKHQLMLDNPIFKTNHGIKIYDVKVTESMFNGTTFSWFSVFDNEIVSGRHLVKVNNDYKKLDIKFDKTSKIKPGQNSQLKIINKSKDAKLEALVTMYDQSLEFYANRDYDYHKRIYENHDYSSEVAFQHEFLQSFDLEWIHPDLKSMLEKFKRNSAVKYRPVLLVDSNRLRQENDFALGLRERFGGGSDKKSSGKMKEGAFAAAPAMMESSAMADAAPMEMQENRLASKPAPAVSKDSTDNSEPTKKPVEIRKNFSETAVFEPFFPINRENATLNFKAPDQLTAWKSKLLAVSSNGLIGEDQQVIQSSKDFFVRVLVTRYLRENDQTEIKLKVDNLTDKKMPAQLSLEISGEGIDVNELFKGQSLKHSVQIAANDSHTQVWKIKVPSVLGAIKIKGVVIADKETDAEEKTISILPSRQRLVENTLAYLKEKQNVLSVKNWDKKDATRINELMSVQIDPQLPIMLLNSIPSLINYPYNCSEQLINKYVPLAIISSMYQKNPKLQEAVKEAFKKKGPRSTITLPWEEKDPRRLMELKFQGNDFAV